MAVATTEPSIRIVDAGGAEAGAKRRPARRRAAGADRLTVGLFSLAAFLLVLAFLAGQLHVIASSTPPRVMVVRKVYVTRVIETVKGGSGRGGTSVSQSVSSAGSAQAVYSAPTTRTS